MFQCLHECVIGTEPCKGRRLLGYSSLIVLRGTQIQRRRVDLVNFRKHAAVFPSEKWAEINPMLWQLAFANSTPCTHCGLSFSLDHTTQQCDDYESGSSSVKAGEVRGKQAGSQTGASTGEPSAGQQPICLHWNQSQCVSATCRFQHICLECHQMHKSQHCPLTRRFAPYKRDRGPSDKGTGPFRKGSPTSW